ncbi:MAG: Wadjet anti-phage system protein JetD domain-containing protein [Verrucomicrobiota bacterium]
MITASDIRAKALRFYESKVLRGAAEFPWVVRGRKTFDDETPLSRRLEILEDLRRNETPQDPNGYTIEWRKRRVDGGQQLPGRIAFENQTDLLAWLGKEAEFSRLQTRQSRIDDEFPQLTNWARENPKKLIKLEGDLDGILEVVGFFRKNPRPGLFVRELPLSVDTKFVERHQRDLRPLLEAVLPAEAIDSGEDEFSRRFGLEWVEPAIRMRFLDPDLQVACGQEYEEFSLPLLTLASRDWPVSSVLVVENLTSLNMLPMIPKTLGLMGHGKRISNFRYISWLERCEIIYYGDIDVQGFEILSSFREFFPQVRSVLMNEKTIRRAPDSAKSVGAPSNWRKELNLTSAERGAYEWAKRDWRRIEQEHLPRDWILREI